MAAFTNQFDLPRVSISRNSGLNQHLLSIKSEIQGSFGSVDLNRLSAIAKQVDQAIQEYAESGNLAETVPLPEFVPLEVLQAERVDVQREVFGDFHLFVAFEAQHPWPRVPAKVARYCPDDTFLRS